MTHALTLGELVASGYTQRSVRQEMRENLIHRIRSEQPLFPGIIGYDDSVIPAVEHAVLAGHDMIFLGERGQGKSRIIRQLVELLDDEVPIVAGSEINDDPLAPVSAWAREQVAELGDKTPIAWVTREERYGEKLATPDVSIADLIGEIDPIRVAEGRYLADEKTIHYGLIPRTNRGVFCINELPDLPERVQVGLFNVLEERDVQVKGFKIRLPLDVIVVASANPEDYTRRGRIITPLKDRYQAQIRTHYPVTRDLEVAVMEQERRKHEAVVSVHLPDFLRAITAEITMQARASSDISQVSGVSVRASISNYETLIAAAERRALRLGEPEAVPRLSDLPAIAWAMGGKVELEYAGTEKSEAEVVERLTRNAVKIVFDELFEPEEIEPIARAFESDGWKVEVGDMLPASEYAEGMDSIAGLRPAVEKLGEATSPARIASAIEFLLEGLHLSNKLNKDVQQGRVLYS